MTGHVFCVFDKFKQMSSLPEHVPVPAPVPVSVPVPVPVTELVKQRKPIICKKCGNSGHNKSNKKCPKYTPPISYLPKELVPLINKNVSDTYTDIVLKEQYGLHKNYVNGRIQTTKTAGISVRLPAIPEDVSENIVKFIIKNILNDTTTTWSHKTGDLYSEKEGIQECKCFTSVGPLSFTPTSNWDVIYFLDAKNWLNDRYVLYKVTLKRTSPEWQSIKMNKTQTFEDQTKQGRRPRIGWDLLFPQISSHCIKVFDGTFEDIFTPIEVVE